MQKDKCPKCGRATKHISFRGKVLTLEEAEQKLEVLRSKERGYPYSGNCDPGFTQHVRARPGNCDPGFYAELPGQRPCRDPGFYIQAPTRSSPEYKKLKREIAELERKIEEAK